jgi:hypothetical protein
MIRRPPRSTPIKSSAASDGIRDRSMREVIGRRLLEVDVG